MSDLSSSSPTASAPIVPSRPRVLDRFRYLVHSQAFTKHPFLTLARLAAWRCMTVMGVPGNIELPPWHLRLYLPPEWIGVSKLLFAFRENYERELSILDAILPEGGVFVDGGANLGIYSLVASRVVGADGTVLAFEPAAKAFALLERHKASNAARNVRLFRGALADRNGHALLRHEPDPGRNSLVGESRSDGTNEPVQTFSLDSVIEDSSLQRLDLIKLDVEGAEELVLRGAAASLERWRPHVLFEVNHDAAARLQLSPTGAWDLLRAHGYLLHQVTAHGQFRRLEVILGGGNYLGIHRSRCQTDQGT